MTKHIRNFSIIAHIDHGKSTLADRFLELTGSIEERQMREQVLDSMELERERGITIKMQPVRMRWEERGVSYELNLIDTPGHIDFSYEVSRALKAVEGSLLLVDATQGVQAQTLSVLSMAREQGLTILPVLTKIDSPLARVDDVKLEVASLLDCDLEDIMEVSGKTGEGVKELLSAIIERIPPPAANDELEAQALVYDFSYSEHQGIILYVRVMQGVIQARSNLSLLAAKQSFVANEVGSFQPEPVASSELSSGEVGYIVTGIKEPGIASVGDTVVPRGSSASALSGYENPRPVVWASMYPESQDEFDDLRQALSRLRLSDSSLSYEEEMSTALGRGFRVGFLGMLHLEIVTERLRREFNLDLIITTPSITYRVKLKGGVEEMIYTPTKFPEHGEVLEIYEPWVEVTIISPTEYLPAMMPLLYEHEAEVGDAESFGDGRSRLVLLMPLRELMRNFFDVLKTATSGYASLSYEPVGERLADVTRLDVLVADEIVPAFSRIISKRRVEEEAGKLVEKLYDIMPRQMFVMKIQAQALGRIISSRTVKAFRKDVTAKLYGGDITRKRKLLEKQKKGKKKMAGRGRVHIPHDVFLKTLKD